MENLKNYSKICRNCCNTAKQSSEGASSYHRQAHIASILGAGASLSAVRGRRDVSSRRPPGARRRANRAAAAGPFNGMTQLGTRFWRRRNYESSGAGFVWATHRALLLRFLRLCGQHVRELSDSETGRCCSYVRLPFSQPTRQQCFFFQISKSLTSIFLL